MKYLLWLASDFTFKLNFVVFEVLQDHFMDKRRQ